MLAANSCASVCVVLLRRRRGRSIHGYARGRFLRAGIVLGDQAIGGRLGRRYRARTAGINLADSVQRDIGSVVGSPGQVVDWPGLTVLGLAVKEAVGAGAGGGGGGGGGAVFFLPQAATIRTTASAMVILLHRLHVRFNSFLQFTREHSHQFLPGPKCAPPAALQRVCP